MPYQPENPPVAETHDEVLQWVFSELQRLSASMSETTALDLRTVHAEPIRPRDGLIVQADGVNWNPGEGAGTYVYRGGAWRLLSRAAVATPHSVAVGGTGQTTEAEAIGELIQALTEDTTPDPDADFVGTYDASADTGKKVKLSNIKPIQAFLIAASNETTNLVVANNLVKFRMPYAFTLTSVRGSLSTAQATGTLLQFDITHNGTTIFSTRPTFDNTETTTQTAATASVLSTTALSDDAEMIVNLTARGAALAKGLKVTLIGRRT